MTTIFDKRDCHGAEFDLSDMFTDMKRVVRKIYIDDSDKVTCIDALETINIKSDVRWNMCTFAKAEIVDDNTILLKENGKSLVVRVVSPTNAKAYIMSNNTNTFYDAKNQGVRVGFAVTMAPNTQCLLKVELEPQK